MDQNQQLLSTNENSKLSFEQFIKEKYCCCNIFKIFIGVANIICALIVGISFASMKSACKDGGSIAGAVICFLSIPLVAGALFYNQKKNPSCATSFFIIAGVGATCLIGLVICVSTVGYNYDLKVVCNYQICQNNEEPIYGPARLVIDVETDSSFSCTSASEQSILNEVQKVYLYECNSCDKDNIVIQNARTYLILSLFPTILIAVITINTLSFTPVFKKIINDKYSKYLQSQNNPLSQ
ncbi:transmembrane protein, putative (macronuclear) [Tetrahymena thermophila SB210]|uniref:Transmembrane protein, putative n=1 Tax=Tetrahymena thermophila (strain SB210) TaxID=312017 RepID=I7MK53_TETTS|nr:transmembrane protein, putative [Tetrahymena thermophila SB210]EAR97542.1 transmembrane protein, putative [Tetrahymena thermophila SB210]|eukprot:XP_001017787.1 transmembrane protein, putative [Tetrahymena thermophila SB210]